MWKSKFYGAFVESQSYRPTIVAMMTNVSASMMAPYAVVPRDEAIMLLSKFCLKERPE